MTQNEMAQRVQQEIEEQQHARYLVTRHSQTLYYGVDGFTAWDVYHRERRLARAYPGQRLSIKRNDIELRAEVL